MQVPYPLSEDIIHISKKQHLRKEDSNNYNNKPLRWPACRLICQIHRAYVIDKHDLHASKAQTESHRHIAKSENLHIS